ncbi:MAG TPA: 3D domain-containing protein [Pyrinomonadaceae bacterium]
MKAIFGRGAIVASILLLGLVAFSAETSIAETLFSRFQPQQTEPGKQVDTAIHEAANELALTEAKPMGPVSHYVATAYSLRGRTASGRMVSKGLIAADPRVLPLGARVRLETGGYSGEYLVADTGRLIKGKRIDIWIPSSREAMRFGRRKVKLTVLSYPQRRTRRTAKA